MHLVETMACAGETSWHGLGKKLEAQQSTEVWRAKVSIGHMPPKGKPGQDASLLEVSGVTVRMGYWRKFDALHRWFVGNVQEGIDDCRPAFVSVDTLIELEGQFDQASDDPASSSEHFIADVDETLEVGEVDYTLKVLHHAKQLQEQGWDIYYRASW